MQIKAQIQNKDEMKKQQRQDQLEEGRRMRMGQADEILKLQSIKSNKLRGLKNLSIPDKYLSDLERHKIGA